MHLHFVTTVVTLIVLFDILKDTDTGGLPKKALNQRLTCMTPKGCKSFRTGVLQGSVRAMSRRPVLDQALSLISLGDN